MRKLKLYKVIADNSEVMAVSLVDEPAIDLDFVHLHKETPQMICLEKDEKHLLVGCVLRPDYPIYRNNGKDEFYLEFPRETVEKLAYDYMQSGRIYSFTTDHKDIADNVSIVESWIKTSESDKSKDYGLDVPIGSWLICAKVEDEAIWKRVKDGELRGFSVESFVNLEEIILSKDKETNMTEEVKLETIEVTEGFWMRIAEVIKAALKSPQCAELEAQVTSAQVIDEMKQEVEEPQVEETLVEENTEVIEEPQVEEPIVEEEVASEPEEIAEEVTEEVVADAETEVEVKEDLQAVIDELNAKIDELNQQLANLQMENQKLSKQPSTKPINLKSESVQGSNFDRMLAIMNGSAFKK